MEREKVKAVITTLCLFLLSILFCFFFLGAIYLIFVAICFFYEEVYDLVHAIWLGIFTAWFLHLAFVSLVYTIRFALRGKNKIAEYWNASSQITPETPTSTIEADDHDQQQQQEPQNLRRSNKVNRVMVGVTKFLCAVTSVYLGVWILVMVIDEVVHEHEKVGRARPRMVLMIIAAFFIFLLFVLVIPVSCIYGRKNCCGGNKTTSTSLKEHDQIQTQQQRSDANP